MSIIIRNNPGGGGVGSYKGFPPGDVKILFSTAYNTNGYIKWEDPDDVIVSGTTISSWAGTILVRKEGSYPTSPKDGTVVVNSTTKNAYKDTDFIDSGLINGDTYYYRFYTYNSNKVYNDSSNMMFKVTCFDANPVLANNTWTQINGLAESGNASTIWSIGDEIDITLSGTYSETLTLQIWDFNHFDKTDGTGKAGITFGCKNLMKDIEYFDSSYIYKWDGSLIRTNVMKNILSSMPSELQSVIKEVNTYALSKTDFMSNEEEMLSTDKVFIPGCTEIKGDDNEINQSQFPIFIDNNNVMKKLSNGIGDYKLWWTRSIYKGYSKLLTTGYNTNVGSITNTMCDANTYNGVCFCFNV